MLTAANDWENPAASLHVIDEDAVHALAEQDEDPNLVDKLKSEIPIELPNTEITIFPRRGPLYRAKVEIIGPL